MAKNQCEKDGCSQQARADGSTVLQPEEIPEIHAQTIANESASPAKTDRTAFGFYFFDVWVGNKKQNADT